LVQRLRLTLTAAHAALNIFVCRNYFRYSKIIPQDKIRVKIGSQEHRNTAISTSNECAIVVRGHNLTNELIGRINFTDHFWLLLTGDLPSEAQRTILDATSVQVSRMTLAASPEALQGAVAAGILGCGSVVLGSSEAAGQFLAEIAQRAVDGDVQTAAAAVIREYRAARRAIPGYGHPLHKDYDPRALRLFEIAADTLGRTIHVEIARTVARLLPSLVGKPLAINVSGAIPAVLLDAGYPIGALKGVPLLARTAGLIAHLLEEQQRPIGFLMSHAAAAAVGYDGERPEGFQESHG
jgi:citrate synthase